MLALVIFTVSLGRFQSSLILSGKDVQGKALSTVVMIFTKYPSPLFIIKIVGSTSPGLVIWSAKARNWNILRSSPFLTRRYLTFSDVPASAAYFASYELIQRGLQGPDRSVFSKSSSNVITIITIWWKLLAKCLVIGSLGKLICIC